MAKKSATPKLVTLVSTLDHPVTISYDGEALILAPRDKVKSIEPSKLGALPKGVRAK
ncbi:hypothetical protein [Pseudoalteromonas umbrosa]|uniref:hypothetical protein n=1 Tax=Pseudoalteromonas umbrosa TaxID=3048489 RepID=UPI0024C42424|nr:hypothetical protein [Pseudoalteromonas sp. B95]MDK1290203.1 hypothetical protein [Pseudoalteromonas sp. B95]